MNRIEQVIKSALGMIKDADEVYSSDKRGTVYIILKNGDRFRVTIEQIVARI